VAIGAGAGNIPSGLALSYLTRKTSEVLSDPRSVRAITTALDNSVTDKARNAALLRLFRLHGEPVIEEQENINLTPVEQ